MKRRKLVSDNSYSVMRVFALLSVFGLFAACMPTLNSDKLEVKIRRWLREEKSSDVQSVSCPKQIKVEEGNTAKCRAEIEDSAQLFVLVTLMSDEGKVSFSLIVDTEIVESTIAEQFTEQSGISVKSVSCPRNIEVKVDDQFNCTLTATDDKSMEAVVTQTNEQGGFSWNATSGLISYDKVEGLIKTGLQDQENLAVTPSCGTPQTRYIIAYSGEKFSCSATDSNGRKIPISVSVQSDDGQVVVNWKL